MRLYLAVAFLLLGSHLMSSAAEKDPQYYEVRSYVLGEKGDPAAIDTFLRDALIPALGRQGIGPIGALTNAANDETDSPRIVVVIPYDRAEQIESVTRALDEDSKYQADAKAYLDRGRDNPPYARIESELLSSMKCMPQLKVDPSSLSKPDRVYELRVYESANERLGNLKVDMFNSGEVPIFLDCGIHPVFIGQALIGPFTPNLSYLTTYPSEEARIEAWKAFRVHPDWTVLKKVAKYQGTVSKIHKYILVPKDYSQM